MSRLPELRIATPCPADWNKMAGNDQVRFCSLCNLNVYNFSEMPEPDVLKILERREGRVCARLYQRADGTILTRDCPVGLRAACRRMIRWATAALAMIFVAPLAKAQHISIHPPEPIVQFEQHESKLLVHVQNRLGDPIRNASVELQDKSLVTQSTAQTDRHGNASLPKPADGTYVLVVQAPLLLTYSRVLSFSQENSSVDVEANVVVMVGALSGWMDNSARDLTPMPMHGIPDFRRTGPNSVR